jgi:hypothetical protein
MKIKTITAIEMTAKEHSCFNDVICTLANVCFDNNATLKDTIEKEWRKNGIYLDIEAVMKALNIICDITDEVVGIE